MTAERVTLDDLAALDEQIAALTELVEHLDDEVARATVALGAARIRQARLIRRYHADAARPLVDQ